MHFVRSDVQNFRFHPAGVVPTHCQEALEGVVACVRRRIGDDARPAPSRDADVGEIQRFGEPAGVTAIGALEEAPVRGKRLGFWIGHVSASTNARQA